MRKSLLIIGLIGLWSSTHASEAWNQKSEFGGVGRHRGTGLSIGNRGYMGLGHYNGAGPNIMFSDWWEFDPGSNTWTQKADYPFPTYAASSFSIGTKGYVGTGVAAGNLFYAYDPFSNTWTSIQSVPMGATDQLAFAVNGKGYYIYSNQVYEYDPGTDVWTAKNNAPFSLWSWSSAFSVDDKAYVKTGNQLWEYKSSTDTWASRAPFPGLASGGSACFATRGKGYIVCGYVGWLSELTTEVWEFDPATNIWSAMPEFPAAGRRFSAAFAIGEKGYVGIGTTGTNMRDFWEFDEYLAVESTENIEMQVYPNPAADHVIVKSIGAANEPLLLILTDVQGKEIIRMDLNEESNYIDLSSFNSGVYIFSIWNSSSLVKTDKLVIQP